MKLADVTSSSPLTSGLPVWNLDASGIPSTIEEVAGGDGELGVDEAGVGNTVGEDEGGICNGYDKSPSGGATEVVSGVVTNSNGCNFGESQQTSPKTAPSTLANSSGAGHLVSPAASLTSGETVGSQDTRKLDPVFEIALDLQVKIADLGNACWVVSSICFTAVVRALS